MSETPTKNYGWGWALFRGSVWTGTYLFFVWPGSLFLMSRATIIRPWAVFGACLLGWLATWVAYWFTERRFGRSRSQVAVLLSVVGGLSFVWVGYWTPHWFQLIHRDGQKRAMAVMRELAATYDGHFEQTGAYPDIGSIEDMGNVWIDGEKFLDPWGSPYRYSRLDSENGYVLVCLGRDRALDDINLANGSEERTIGFDADIVVRDGRFVRWPEGIQP